MEKVKVLSLFDGISCGMVALERAGYKVERYYAYEIEPSAITISKKNYPEIIQLGDVFNTDFAQFAVQEIIMSSAAARALSTSIPTPGWQSIIQ